MRKFRAIFAREYLERVRTKWFLIATIFGPVLFGALFLLPMLLSTRAARSNQLGQTVIIDATGAGLGERVVRGMTTLSSGEPTIEVREVTLPELAAAESLATAQVMAGEQRGFVVLDTQTTAGVEARYAGRDASSLPTMERLERSIREAVLARRLEQQGMSAEEIGEVSRMRPTLRSERITDRGRGGSGIASFIFAFGVALYLYAAIILYGNNVLRGVMEEKQSRVAEVVLSSVSANRLLAGKVLGVGAVGLTQMILWTISGVAIYKLRAPLLEQLGRDAPMTAALPDVSLGIWIIYLAYFVLGFLLYASLFAAVGAMVSSEQEAQQAAQPVMLLIVASVIFMQPILFDPGGTLAQVMTLVPFSSPILMPMRMSMVPVPTGEIAMSLAILALSSAAVIWLAARIYRVGLLMYGKRPTMRELARWVRYAG